MSETLVSFKLLLFKILDSFKSLSILKGPLFLKKGFNIKEYLSKLWIFLVSTIITNYFLSTIVADH